MKNTTLKLSTLLAITISLFAFTSGIITHKVDTEKSTVAWYGQKITGDSHNGYIKLKSGSLLLEKGLLKGGSFIVDMTTITNEDVSNETYRKKLEDHLMNEDFFDSKKFPEAKFKITSFTSKSDHNYDINGDLTIKGKTKEISFPAIVTEKDGIVTASAKFTFDRSQFDVRYGSDSFFDNLGNKAISNDITLTINLIATK